MRRRRRSLVKLAKARVCFSPLLLLLQSGGVEGGRLEILVRVGGDAEGAEERAACGLGRSTARTFHREGRDRDSMGRGRSSCGVARSVKSSQARAPGDWGNLSRHARAARRRRTVA